MRYNSCCSTWFYFAVHVERQTKFLEFIHDVVHFRECDYGQDDLNQHDGEDKKHKDHFHYEAPFFLNDSELNICEQMWSRTFSAQARVETPAGRKDTCHLASASA